MIDWQGIRTVFLDLDGTLLDLRFDNYFWHRYLPRCYADAYGLDPEEAREDLTRRYRAMRGTLQWYCARYWSTELGLDVVALKHEIRHRVARMPHVGEFLARVRDSGRGCYLVTNCHPEFLDIKLAEARLSGQFDRAISSHEFGVPKESASFWESLCNAVDHRPAQTLMVDDNKEVLDHAARAGIGFLITIRQPDSGQLPREESAYPAIQRFSEIMPPIPGPSV